MVATPLLSSVRCLLTIVPVGAGRTMVAEEGGGVPVGVAITEAESQRIMGIV